MVATVGNSHVLPGKASEKKKPMIIADHGFSFGARCRIRTGHLMITSQLLYQMS
jgi:hypothetical protein